MHHIEIASFWPGYTVTAHTVSDNQRILFTLEPRADLLPCCRRCLQPTPLIHDQRIRRVRERDLFDRQVWLQLPVRRVDCLRCGRVSEQSLHGETGIMRMALAPLPLVAGLGPTFFTGSRTWPY